MAAEQDDASPWVPDRPTVRRLEQAVQECRGCELWQDATQAVLSAGSAKARVMLVGEQPGDQEDKQGEPFVGPAGRVLAEAMEAAGLDRPEVYLTNAVKHFRHEQRGKRRIHQAPELRHLLACRPWLEAEFTVLQPEVVVCLGATAAKALISPSFRITKERGQLLPWTPPGVARAEAGDDSPADDDEDAPHQTWMLATTHPSAILRTPDEARAAAYDALVADLRVVAHALA